MRCADVIVWLKTKYPGIGIYNGTIPKNDDCCIGIYLKDRGSPVIAVGGLSCTSTAILPVSILVHWGQDADVCEAMAQGIYDRMLGNTTEIIGGTHVAQFALQDSTPVDITRDENGICEMVIRVNIVYER